MPRLGSCCKTKQQRHLLRHKKNKTSYAKQNDQDLFNTTQ